MSSSPAGPICRGFCLGQAKSGTASLAGLLGKHFRAAHEPERAETLNMVLRESRGEVDAESFRNYLRVRDSRLDLHYDIAWANQFIAGHLASAFPDAKFIALVRHPISWVESVVGHLISRPIPEEVRRFLDWWFRPERFPHRAADAGLASRGLYSVAAYVSGWKRHVELCESLIPSGRFLLVKTHELAQAHQRIAAFLEIGEDTLNPTNGYLNRRTWTGSFASLVDPAFVYETVMAVCGDHVDRLFSENGRP